MFRKPPKRKDVAVLEKVRAATCFRCRGAPCEAHHLPSPFGGSRRAVDIVVPLCRDCHAHYHAHPSSERADLDHLYAHAYSFYVAVHGGDWGAFWLAELERLDA